MAFGSRRKGKVVEMRAESAVRIQKAVRGFLARKGLKKVRALRREVDDIERRIRDQDLMRRPGSRDRAKLMEALMSLLLNLDSVRAVDYGVRECRKATINKAIAMQEAIDFTTHPHTPNSDDAYLMQRIKEQSRLITSLTRRVELLEKALLGLKLIRKSTNAKPHC